MTSHRLVATATYYWDHRLDIYCYVTDVSMVTDVGMLIVILFIMTIIRVTVHL